MSLSLSIKPTLFIFIYLGLISCSQLLVINHAIKAEECHTGKDVPASYRMERYRSPTPPCSPNATTLSTQQLQQLIVEDTSLVLIDVLAITRRPELDDFGGEWLPNKKRYNIPGSIWLPSVGYGELDEEMDAYFYRELEQPCTGRLFKTNPYLLCDRLLDFVERRQTSRLLWLLESVLVSTGYRRLESGWF